MRLDTDSWLFAREMGIVPHSSSMAALSASDSGENGPELAQPPKTIEKTIKQASWGIVFLSGRLWPMGVNIVDHEGMDRLTGLVPLAKMRVIGGKTGMAVG